jgi:adenosylmethionine-8-amino-7-oxononanoate aminotransferase
LTIVGGDGCYVIDEQGRRYLDGQAGLWCVNVGHGHPEVNAAIRDQLDRLAYYNTFAEQTNDRAEELSARLLELTAPEDTVGVLFGSGGSDAVETALKLARHYWRLRGEPQRHRFISLNYGYHGVHFGGTSVNGQAEVFGHPYEPLVPGCSQITSPFAYHHHLGDDLDALAEAVAGELDAEIERLGPHTVAAFIAEPIQGAGGVIVPPPRFWPLVREVCDRHGVLLISDEVVSGFGRTGSMLGCRGWGVIPDLMTFAKGLSSGYVPISAVTVSQRVAEAWVDPVRGTSPALMHGYTYGGHPLGAAAALASLDIVERDDLPAAAHERGAMMLEHLTGYRDRFEVVGDTRGKGLMMAVELVTDRTLKSPVPGSVGVEIQRLAMERGAIIRASGHKLIISPPLTITDAEARELLSILDDALEAWDATPGPLNS